MVSNFKNNPHKNFTADFEVKEYGKKGFHLGSRLLKDNSATFNLIFIISGTIVYQSTYVKMAHFYNLWLTKQDVLISNDAIM